MTDGYTRAQQGAMKRAVAGIDDARTEIEVAARLLESLGLDRDGRALRAVSARLASTKSVLTTMVVR
jgi:hypothetical protein